MKKEKENKDDLKLPVIKGDIPLPSLRSADEINQWIEEDYMLFFDRKRYYTEKRLHSVNVKFVL